MACPQRCSTVIIPDDLHLHGGESLLEIGPDRSNENQEHKFLCRFYANLGAGADQQGAGWRRVKSGIVRTP